MDNDNLIKGLKNGNPLAYTHMVEQYHQKLCSYTLSLTRNQELAEDIVQTVYVKIWRKRKKIKTDIDLQNYLYKSVYNAFIDEYRKQKAIFSLEKIHIDTLKTFIEDTSQNNKEGLYSMIKKEIGNLPPKCKQVFLLSKKEGLTNIEIAEYLNISKKSVEGHITKAFSLLRERLGDQYRTILFLIFQQPSEVRLS